MGIVYEAEQMSLGRRVALKVLPFAATMDARQLQRFRNESHAAAQLHHTNIVPVYYVGCERGVHFYAMQFIEGQSLADVIAELRKPSEPRPSGSGGSTGDPTTAYAPLPDGRGSESTRPIAALSTLRSTKDAAYFRTGAQLGIQAAEALDYAHQQGIVHRDVKPANLLVDAAARLWVTDFGLAQVQSDTRLTMSGDLVGTLRYMSPEQALAKRVVVDHRTDIYSLGATLYELLTLEPVFACADRQELLRQIAFEEPIPPRRRNKTIPAELETIVLKALEKNPADRYATSQELAEDLQRYLKDEPIRARRPTLVQHARKWAMRHKPVVWSAAVSSIALIAMLGAGLGWIFRDRAARNQQNLIEVEYALQDADRDLKAKKWVDSRAAVLRARSLLTTGAGDDRLEQRASDLITDLEMVATIDDIRLEASAVKDGHFDWERTTTRFVEAFRDYGIDVEALPATDAANRIREKPIAAELTAGLDAWSARLSRVEPRRKSLLVIARLADPVNDAWRQELRRALEQGAAETIQRLAGEAEQHALAAGTVLLLTQALIDPYTPSKRPAFDRGLMKLAVTLLRKAQLQHPDDFWVNHQLAEYLYFIQPPQLDDAVAFYQAALALRSQSPIVCFNLSNALRDKGNLAGALAVCEKAIALKPDSPQAHSNLGVVLLDKGDAGGAITAFHSAIALKPDLAGAHDNLGNALYAKGDLDGAIAAHRRAIALKPNNAQAHTNLGSDLLAKGDLVGALAALERAIALEPHYAVAHYNLGCGREAKGDPVGAVAAYQRAIALKPDYAEAHCNLGRALISQGKHQEALRFYERALAAQPKFASALDTYIRYNAACAAALASADQSKDAGNLKDDERKRLRSLAFDWLQADLKAWAKQLESTPAASRLKVYEALQHWQRDTDLASVREPDRVAKLPPAEQEAWRGLWAEVAKTLEGASILKDAEPKLVPLPREVP